MAIFVKSHNDVQMFPSIVWVEANKSSINQTAIHLQHAIIVSSMSLSKHSERSPLLAQTDDVSNLPAAGRSHEDGERGDPNSLLCRDEQPSNARLALIMGSIWVNYAENARLEA